MPTIIPVTTAAAPPYADENLRRRAAGLPEIRVARTGYSPVTLVTPTKPVASKAPPKPAPRARPSRLVWIRLGLSNSGAIEGRGHSAVCEAWEPGAVQRAADRIATGAVPFRVSIDHARVVDDFRSGRISVRYMGGDILVRWRPGPEHYELVQEIARKGRVGASVDIAGNAKSTSDGTIRMIHAGDVRGVAILPDAAGAYIVAGAVVGGTEGSIEDLGTATKYLAACGDFTTEAAS